MEDPVIQLNGLTKFYGKTKAVDNLSLRINRGEIFGLLGPNGAGKTTTILMMLGLAEPSSGTALVCDIDATRNPVAVKKRVGYLPDNVGFYGGMTALENLMYIGRLNGIAEDDIEKQAKMVLQVVGLENEMDKKASAYSRGMKQRLGLADVLIKEPEIIVLDEPTLGIDPSGIKEFLTLIYELSRQQGLTVLISSHLLHQMQQVCDRVGIFVGGKLLVEGNIETLSRNLFGEESYVVEVTLRENLTNTWEPFEELTRLHSVKGFNVNGNTIVISSQEDVTPEIVRFFIQKGLSVTGVTRKEFGLDEIYHRYFDESQNGKIPARKFNGLFKKSFLKSNND